MEKDTGDDILSKRKFQNASGINLGSFLLDSADENSEVEIVEPEEEKEHDIAMGLSLIHI